MKLSELYLKKHTDCYANFGYKDEGGTYNSAGSYSSAGIEIEHAETYGRLRDLEARTEKLEYNERHIPKGEYESQMANINSELLSIKTKENL